MLHIYATQREEIREQFAQGLHRQVPGSGGKVMNYLEQLVEQARQEGRQEGELATSERLVRARVEWNIIESAPGIDRAALRTLSRLDATFARERTPSEAHAPTAPAGRFRR